MARGRKQKSSRRGRGGGGGRRQPPQEPVVVQTATPAQDEPVVVEASWASEEVPTASVVDSEVHHEGSVGRANALAAELEMEARTASNPLSSFANNSGNDSIDNCRKFFEINCSCNDFEAKLYLVKTMSISQLKNRKSALKFNTRNKIKTLRIPYVESEETREVVVKGLETQVEIQRRMDAVNGEIKFSLDRAFVDFMIACRVFPDYYDWDNLSHTNKLELKSVIDDNKPYIQEIMDNGFEFCGDSWTGNEFMDAVVCWVIYERYMEDFLPHGKEPKLLTLCRMTENDCKVEDGIEDLKNKIVEGFRVERLLLEIDRLSQMYGDHNVKVLQKILMGDRRGIDRLVWELTGQFQRNLMYSVLGIKGVKEGNIEYEKGEPTMDKIREEVGKYQDCINQVSITINNMTEKFFAIDWVKSHFARMFGEEAIPPKEHMLDFKEELSQLVWDTTIGLTYDDDL